MEFYFIMYKDFVLVKKCMGILLYFRVLYGFIWYNVLEIVKNIICLFRVCFRVE